MRHRRYEKLATASMAALLIVALPDGADAQQAATPDQKPRVAVDPDGTVHISDFAVPLSGFISDDARKVEAAQITAHGWPQPSGPITGPGPVIDNWRKEMNDKIFSPALARQRAVYDVDITEKTIAGVKTDVVTPKAGIASENKNRVLINLHSGGFQMGSGPAALTESVPIAAVGKIEVVTVDYRQGPEYKFPAASEDVAAVYRELLKTHQPKNIGIYGCSAGGALSADSIAWFEKEKLPLPGAIGIFSSSAGGGPGDSTYIGPFLNGQTPPLPVQRSGAAPAAHGYFEGVDPKNPLRAPIYYPDLLAKFPPTLVITATRDMAMSGAIHTHAELVKAGADAELHVWEGLGHCFFYSVDMPESKDAYNVIVKFFDRHLGK
ncbi:MAG TPA: alpha/beta hydrolase fold domain-containing protein [Alphaproteobacteria bacterium]|nr:alpha/beta hydrolase fold domain-containing protein [Alphaproteobacteria bacterium]